MSKPIGVRIDDRQEEVWNKFKDFVEEKYGKKHTVLGNELVKALELYLELYEKADKGKIDFQTHLIKTRAGDLEVKSLKEISYDLLNTLVTTRGYIETLKDDIEDAELRMKLERIRQSVIKAQRMIQDRIENIG